MQAEASADECRIGEWIFSPAANELRAGTERRRLEHRAARTLELLCRRRGAIVSQEEILAEVWNGRAISPNSVPVVVKDLRQALGDDAREPRHIETVAKRGYRLLADVGAAEDAAAPQIPARPGRGRGPLVLLTVLLLALGLAVLGWALQPRASTALPLIVTEVENATGSARYQPLASASGAVIMTNTQRLEGVQVFRATEGRSPAGAVTLGARLILWSGRPTVMMSAQDERGVVIWTGMTSGEEDLIPREVAAAMRKLGEKMRDAKTGSR